MLHDYARKPGASAMRSAEGSGGLPTDLLFDSRRQLSDRRCCRLLLLRLVGHVERGPSGSSGLQRRQDGTEDRGSVQLIQRSARRLLDCSTVPMLTVDGQTESDSANQTDFDGTMRYLSDLDVAPEDPSVICLAHLLRAPRMGVFDKKGWVDGWKSASLRVGSGGDLIPGQKQKVRELGSHLKTDPTYFAEVYRFTFDWGKEEGQKSLGESGRHAIKL